MTQGLSARGRVVGDMQVLASTVGPIAAKKFRNFEILHDVLPIRTFRSTRLMAICLYASRLERGRLSRSWRSKVANMTSTVGTMPFP
jgi:hypothetical protein